MGTACVVMFCAGETTPEHKYSTMFGNGKWSARFQRPPPSLSPSRRALRKDIGSERTLQELSKNSPTCSSGNARQLERAARRGLPPRGSETSHLHAVARGGRRTRGAAVRKLQGVGNSTFVLSVENDNDFRSRCE